MMGRGVEVGVRAERAGELCGAQGRSRAQSRSGAEAGEGEGSVELRRK